MTNGTRWGALWVVAALWCRGTFGSAATGQGIEIFNIHVDEYAAKAVVTWETTVRTDTAVRFGRTAAYGRARANAEQKSETVHSITLEALTPDTDYHYRIDAKDPRGVLPDHSSDDLTFRTSKSDAPEGKENAGLLNLTKCYVDRLTRMPADERAKLKASILKFTDPAPRKDPIARSAEPASGDSFAKIEDNPFRRAAQEPLSTFAIDVDTASYALVRRYLAAGAVPPTDAVRIEELINTFTYSYPAPDAGETLTAHAEVAACPWEPAHRLLKVGLKGQEVASDKRPATNLVFLIDVSGSMNVPDRLPLVIQSMKLLLASLRAQDRVSIVVYAGSSGLVLPPTPGDQTSVIAGALDRLHAGGSTNGGAGLALAYRTAQDAFIQGGVNRVLLCTDGDFNVGLTGPDQLVQLVAERAKGGVFLSVLGYGIGDFHDSLVEQIADKGHGNYSYIDSIKEARKVLVTQAGGTLQTIAKDVKLQLDFNPRTVESYRLIGYENRLMPAQDFNDDKKDAGDLGAGHTVTALYELVPTGAGAGELVTLKLRYKQPAEDRSRLLEFHVSDCATKFESASADMRFAAAVASFGMLLRQSPHKGASSWDAVASIAESALGADPNGYRHDFLSMVNRARTCAK